MTIVKTIGMMAGLLLLAAGSSSLMAEGVHPDGEGVGGLTDYLPERQVVVMREREMPLSPGAAVSLSQQLKALRWHRGGKDAVFAKFIVHAGTIHEIVVHRTTP